METNKEKILRWINDLQDVSDGMAGDIGKIFTKYYEKNELSFTEKRLRNLYETINLNNDTEYNKHLERQAQIKTKVLATVSVPECRNIKKEPAKNRKGVKQLITSENGRDVTINVENGIEISREYLEEGEA